MAQRQRPGRTESVSAAAATLPLATSSQPQGGASTSLPSPTPEETERLNTTPEPLQTSNGAIPQSQLGGLKHCEFCLIAEFDIDKGSTLSHQYPHPVPYDDHVIAELMLPDGAHARAEDWTVFFLKSPNSAAVSSTLQSAEGGDTRGTDAGGEQVASRGESTVSKDLIYVLNLVRTKHDNTVRRGAMVKALCIGTRHPFIHIFKPALLLALEDYFQSPDINCLMRLYEALNGMDLSTMPNFSREEKLMLRSYDRPDLFEERFIQPRGGSSVTRALEEMERPPSSLSGAGRDGETPLSPSQSRLTSDSGEATPSDSSLAQVQSSSSSNSRMMPRRPSHTSLRQSFMRRPSVSALNAAEKERRPSKGSTSANPSPSPSPAPLSSQHAPRASTPFMLPRQQDTHFFDTSLMYRDSPLPLKVPIAQFPEEVGEFSLINFIQTFSGATSIASGPQHPHLHTNGSLTHPIILLFNALTTQKRVVILGHNMPAGKVASAVLAACALGSGSGTIFRGFAQRAFPYTNLTNLDELETVPGYIAGVTNPRFEDLNAWDVLLNLETGKMTISKNIEPAPPMLVKPRSAARDTFSSASISSTGQGYGSPTAFDASSVRSDHESSAPTTAAVTTKSGKTAPIEARTDALDNIFMEDIMASISAHCSEAYIRARIGDYAQNFARIVARHEEHFYGRTSIGPPSQPYLNGQLGSGVVYSDRETELREVQVNAMRVEGWRATVGYQLYKADEVARQRHCTVRGFDLAHQIHRLKRARQLAHGEPELIFEVVSKNVKTYSQVNELLALLPLYSGGLLPLGFGLFHPSYSTRTHTIDLLLTISQHPAGRLYVQALNVFQRLAFARALQTRAAHTDVAASSYGAPGRSHIEPSGRETVGIRNAMANLYVDAGASQESSNQGDQSFDSFEADEEQGALHDTSGTVVPASSPSSRYESSPQSQLRDGLPSSSDALPFKFPTGGGPKNAAEEGGTGTNGLPSASAAALS